MNICNKINESFWGSLSYIKCRASECFDKPRRRPEIHITSGARRPGPRHVQLSRLQRLIESDELDPSHILGELKRFARSPITLVRDTVYFSGYLDPILRHAGTDLKNNLLPYIANPLSIRCKNFMGEAFKNSDIEKCALSAIRWLNDIYRDCPSEVVQLNIIGHSMGARIAERVAQIINEYPELADKKYIIKKIISLNGANKGSPVAWMSGSLVCCKENIAKSLRPHIVKNEDLEYKRLKTRATYIAVENDPIIPPDYAAPPNYPVIVLRDVSRFSPHTAILDDPIAKYILLKQLAGF